MASVFRSSRLPLCRPWAPQLPHFLNWSARHPVPHRIHRNLYTHNPHTHIPVTRKRVLGVIAHINSGKTTTSEAMLYASGALTRMGNVDVGDTTMDFLPAERERGITVNAAAMGLDWRRHHIFLVDSPGHLDFTFEVERALRVMDAVVVLLDAVAGVQPQTETVWRQADANSLPRIVFINKMDRDGADFHATVANIRHFFNAVPIVIQLPLFDPSTTSFSAVYSLLDRFPLDDDAHDSALSFPDATDAPSSSDVTPVLYSSLSEQQKEKIDAAVELLVETCAEVDDHIMQLWLNGQIISRQEIVQAVRHACLRRTLVPVLCGASLREIGIQHLLDSIVYFLPSPLDRPPLFALPVGDDSTKFMSNSKTTSPFERRTSPFVAYAFKVTHDKHRGRMVHLRALSGNLEQRALFINTTNGKKEQPTRLLRVLADKYEDIDSIETGDIFAAVGLKKTATGDTIMLLGTPKSSQVVLDGVRAPPAVFAVALEVESSSNEKDLNTALHRLVDEDASLELRQDDETGETLLAGMGELHLDVAIDHMQRKLPFEVNKSHPRVAYREGITTAVHHTEVLNTVIGTTRLSGALHISVGALADGAYENDVTIEDGMFNEQEKEAVQQGISAGLGRGPVIGATLMGVTVNVRSVSDSGVINGLVGLRACASKGVQSAIHKCEAVVMEPVVRVEASVPKDCVGDVVSELTHPTRRRGVIEDVTADEGMEEEGNRRGRSIVTAMVPVEGMIGWATKMRSITKGRGDLQTTFAEYRKVDECTQARIVTRL